MKAKFVTVMLLHVTKKEPIKENKLHEPEDPDDLQGETFDMTDITDERKDSKGKCEIS